VQINRLEGASKFIVATDVVLKYTSLVNNFSGHYVETTAAYPKDRLSMSEGSVGSSGWHMRNNQIRNPKFETISNFQNPDVQND
jgi:hypothetical protein